MGEAREVDDFSFAEVKLLINISLIEKPRDEVLTLSMMAEKIGTQQSSPSFNKVITFLKSESIIEVHPYLGNTKIVKVDDTKLTDLIDNQKITNFFYDYFREWHSITW